MSRSWQLAAAAVAGLVLLVAGAVWLGGDEGLVGGAPTPSPTPIRVPAESDVLQPTPDVASVRPTPIDTTGWIPFTSQRYGYELAIPPTWVTRPAVREWSLETDNMEGGDPGTDSFAPDGLIDLHKTAPAGATVLNVFAAPATKEVSDQDWLRADGAACAVLDPLKGRADLVEPVTVDGHRGLIGWGCGSSVAVVFVDDRVYVFGLEMDERTELLRTLLSTVRFADAPSP